MPYPTGLTMECRDCAQDLPISKFSRNGRKDGYRRPECRACQHQRSKAINNKYQYTAGAVAARATHNGMQRDEIDRIKRKKLKLQGEECVYCTKKLSVSNSHLDHMKPLARGGADTDSNLQLLCSRCNQEKHSKTHLEYVAWLKQLGENKACDRSNKFRT